MDSVPPLRARPTGLEVDTPYYMTRGGLDGLFRLWVRVDDEAPRQLYRGFRHCIPLEAGPHRVCVWYGDAKKRGVAIETFELAEGEVRRIAYQAPFTLFFEATVFVGDGRFESERAIASFAPEAWAAPAEGRFEEVALVPIWPAFRGGEPISRADQRRHAASFRALRNLQHEPGRNHLLLAACLLPLVGSIGWIGRAFLVGGDAWYALLLMPFAWLAMAWAISLTPREGPAFHPLKLGATLGLVASSFLSIGGLAEGWALPSTSEHRAEARAQEIRDANEAVHLLDRAQATARSGDVAAAVVLLERARDLDPHDIEVRIALANGLARIGRGEDAMLEVIASFDEHPAISAQRLARRPDLVRALGHFDSFRALRGLHPEIDDQLGRLGFGEEWESEDLVL